MTGELNSDVAFPKQPASLPDETHPCPACGTFNLSLARSCVQCGADLPATDSQYDTPSTVPMRRQPQTIPVERETPSRLPPEATALLQFLPSGACHTVDIREPLVLGRSTNTTAESILDLTGLNALAHGVSRRHCLLQRRGEYLSIMDLGSVNGTFLNDLKLMPYVDYVVSHGDHLILGTLHFAIFFGDVDDAR